MGAGAGRHDIAGHCRGEKRQKFSLVSAEHLGGGNAGLQQPDRYAGYARGLAEAPECQLGDLAIGHHLGTAHVDLLVLALSGFNADFRKICTVDGIAFAAAFSDEIDTAFSGHA